MILAGLTVTSTRKEVVDFTYPYMGEETTVGITLPPNDNIFYIFSGLGSYVWLVTGITIVVVGLLVYYIQGKVDDTAQFSLGESIVLSFGAFALQGK